MRFGILKCPAFQALAVVDSKQAETAHEILTPPGGGGVLPYVVLTGTYVRPDRVWFSGCFVLNRVSISSVSALNRVSLHDLMA